MRSPLLFTMIAGCTAAAVTFAVLRTGRSISISSSLPASTTEVTLHNGVREPEPMRAANPFTGIPCAAGEPSRPYAVMIAGDAVTRPLSGIAAADLVVEMPVITWGINRLMAVFACMPEEGADIEIGSVRSARDDYLPLAAAFDAIYGHWGGSHFALDELNTGIIDHIDALRNPFGAYFRKRGIVAPHNGFTTLRRLRAAAEKLGYRLTPTPSFAGYPHIDQSIPAPAALSVTIGYPGSSRVEWKYDGEKQRYLRSRGNAPEIDKNTGAQVAAGTIVLLRTTSRQIEGQYNDVRVTGEGEATVYRNGEAVAGRWEKAASPLSAPLRFLDPNGAEIPFAEGPVWIEIVQTDTPVTAGP